MECPPVPGSHPLDPAGSTCTSLLRQLPPSLPCSPGHTEQSPKGLRGPSRQQQIRIFMCGWMEAAWGPRGCWRETGGRPPWDPVRPTLQGPQGRVGLGRAAKVPLGPLPGKVHRPGAGPKKKKREKKKKNNKGRGRANLLFMLRQLVLWFLGLWTQTELHH